MSPDTKRHFLDCHSLAEMAITLVVLGVILILPTAFLSVFCALVLGLPKYIAFSIPLGLWLLSILDMRRHFARIGRSCSEPRLATKEFSYFQWASIGFVLLLTLAFPSPEVAPAINGVRLFLAAVFVMANLAYFSLALAIKAELPTRILWGIVTSILVAVLAIWRR